MSILYYFIASINTSEIQVEIGKELNLTKAEVQIFQIVDTCFGLISPHHEDKLVRIMYL